MSNLGVTFPSLPIVAGADKYLLDYCRVFVPAGMNTNCNLSNEDKSQMLVGVSGILSGGKRA